MPEHNIDGVADRKVYLSPDAVKRWGLNDSMYEIGTLDTTTMRLHTVNGPTVPLTQEDIHILQRHMGMLGVS